MQRSFLPFKMLCVFPVRSDRDFGLWSCLSDVDHYAAVVFILGFQVNNIRGSCFSNKRVCLSVKWR